MASSPSNHSRRRGKWIFSGLVLALLALAGAYRLGLEQGARMAGEDRAAAALQALAQERSRLQAMRASVQADLDALALQLGRMRAHLMRLDALGQRLVALGKLDPEEFDFGSDPARGGADQGNARTLGHADLVRELDRLQRSLNDRAHKLEVLEELLRRRALDDETTISGRPVKHGWISSTFGTRIDPFTGKKKFHRGIDFAGRAGSEVLAVAAGVVVASEWQHGYGNVVEIRHPGGYITHYAHNRENLVKVGDRVEKGEPIAILGSTGRSSGPHVHFGVRRDGKVIDPARFIGRG